MVLPTKIFKIRERVDFGSVLEELETFRKEEPYQKENGETTNLVSEFLDLEVQEEVLYGVFTRDFVTKNNYKRQVVESLVTEEAPFWLKYFEEEPVLIVQAPSGGKKLLAPSVASRLNEILFPQPGYIVEGRISHETLKELHESNPEATKLIWFDQVDLPGVEKLCLAGSDVVNTRLYRDHLEHGKIWYVVFEDQKLEIVVGVTRDCVATLFSKRSAKEFVNYITDDILPLME